MSQMSKDADLLKLGHRLLLLLLYTSCTSNIPGSEVLLTKVTFFLPGVTWAYT